MGRGHCLVVMAGLGPATHDFAASTTVSHGWPAFANHDNGEKSKPTYPIEICVKSTNQLCTGTNLFTFFDIARRFKSCTMNSHGASSTILACAAASSFVCSAVSKL